MNVVYVDRQGCLCTAHWTRWNQRWPDFRVERLEQQPSCQPGSQLACVSPNPDDLLVFGVGRDSTLRFCFFRQGTGWSPVQRLGTVSDRVGIHTRLAAAVHGRDMVRLAALTDRGAPVIYDLRLSNNAWAISGLRVELVLPPARNPGPLAQATTAFADAAGCQINPFGDLALLPPSGSGSGLLFCAGIRATDPVLLRCELGPPARWACAGAS